MNASQRKVHARLWLVLGGLLLAVLTISMAIRPEGLGAAGDRRGLTRTP